MMYDDCGWSFVFFKLFVCISWLSIPIEAIMLEDEDTIINNYCDSQHQFNNIDFYFLAIDNF